MQLRQILAHNLKTAMAHTPGAETQLALAKKAGIAQSHLSKLLRLEAAATTDLIAALARAPGREPWELLADSEATRQAALQRMILGNRAPDARVNELLPPAPIPEVARRKKGRGR